MKFESQTVYIYNDIENCEGESAYWRIVGQPYCESSESKILSFVDQYHSETIRGSIHLITVNEVNASLYRHLLSHAIQSQ